MYVVNSGDEYWATRIDKLMEQGYTADEAHSKTSAEYELEQFFMTQSGRYKKPVREKKMSFWQKLKYWFIGD